MPLLVVLLSLLLISPLASAGDRNSCLQFMSGEPVIEIDTDYHREWGVILLSQNDRVYQSAEYRKNVEMAMTVGTVSHYPALHPFRTPLTKMYELYSRIFSSTDMWVPQILRFTNSGTEANNVFYEYAEHAYFKRTGKRAKRANLLYFGTPYGGTFGRIAEIGARYKTDPKIQRNFQIPTPFTKNIFKQTPEETARLEIIEAQALEFIRKQVARDRLEIGGIFIEPVTTVGGIFGYRPQFLKKLRELANELNVPIMADEIFTGGGRTGKFWAMQLYGDEFRPDLFSFGKGLALNGVAEMSPFPPRWIWPTFDNSTYKKEYTYPENVLDNTSRVHPLALAQGLAILERIHYDDLPQNAKIVGDYAMKKIKQIAKKKGFENDITGIGLLIHVGSHTKDLVSIDDFKDYEGRWSAPLTTTKDDFDTLLGAKK